MRVGALGPKYFSSNIARIEFAILVLSILDICAQASGLAQQHSSLNALRIVRAFRVLRLVRLSPEWMDVFNRIIQALPSALTALSLMIVFTVTFALVGMQVCSFGCGRTCMLQQ